MTNPEKAGDVLFLRHGRAEVPLHPGDWLIGRDADCLLTLDDALVSRRHAKIHVGPGGVSISDLSSANGVYVNGRKVKDSSPISVGDRILIGGEELVVLRPEQTRRANLHEPAPATIRRSEPTPARTSDRTPPPDATNRVDTLALLCTVVDRVLADGRAADAERLLMPHLDVMAGDAARGKGVPEVVSRRAAEYSIKLAEATGNGGWIDRVIKLHGALRRPIPSDIATALVRAATIAPSFDRAGLRSYVSSLRALGDRLTLPEREGLARLEGLSRA